MSFSLGVRYGSTHLQCFRRMFAGWGRQNPCTALTRSTIHAPRMAIEKRRSGAKSRHREGAHTRNSYSHCSSSFSSRFIHSSASSPHFSRSLGCSGMNLITNNRTAPSTKSRERTMFTFSSSSRGTHKPHTILVRGPILSYRSPLPKALAEKNHCLDKHPNGENSIWGICTSFQQKER